MLSLPFIILLMVSPTVPSTKFAGISIFEGIIEPNNGKKGLPLFIKFRINQGEVQINTIDAKISIDFKASLSSFLSRAIINPINNVRKNTIIIPLYLVPKLKPAPTAEIIKYFLFERPLSNHLIKYMIAKVEKNNNPRST
jgi:hypothetical protein